MPSANPLAVQHPLYQSIVSAPTVGTAIGERIKAAIGALFAWIMANGRTLIDEPAERQQIEAVAVQAFNALFAVELGIAGTAAADAFLAGAIDHVLLALAAAPPAPTPAPAAVVVAPIGAASP